MVNDDMALVRTMFPAGTLSGWLYRIVELVFSERSGVRDVYWKADSVFPF
jgi:hypothetical protein